MAILDRGEVLEEGEVAEIFAHPKTTAAKRLVFPEGNTAPLLRRSAEAQLVRVIFNGAAAAGTPLIARMAVEKGLVASILYASARTIGDKIYGSMLLELPAGERRCKRPGII